MVSDFEGLMAEMGIKNRSGERFKSNYLISVFKAASTI